MPLPPGYWSDAFGWVVVPECVYTPPLTEEESRRLTDEEARSFLARLLLMSDGEAA